MTTTLDVTVITGMSGAGRSAAADVLEDLGFFVIDNLPPALIANVCELASDKKKPQRFALVVDVRSGEFVAELEARARAAPRARRAHPGAVPRRVRRRARAALRRHPAQAPAGRGRPRHRRHRAGAPPARGPEGRSRRGGRHVRPQRARAARPAPRAVRRRHDTEGALRTSVVSFGYKHGLPVDVDLVFDCRFLPNPHWVDELRPLPGTDPLVREYVLRTPEAAPFLDELERMMAPAAPRVRAPGQDLPLDRDRLHRRPAPQRRHRRRARGPAAAPRLPAQLCTTGTSIVSDLRAGRPRGGRARRRARARGGAARDPPVRVVDHRDRECRRRRRFVGAASPRPRRAPPGRPASLPRRAGRRRAVGGRVRVPLRRGRARRPRARQPHARRSHRHHRRLHRRARRRRAAPGYGRARPAGHHRAGGAQGRGRSRDLRRWRARSRCRTAQHPPCRPGPRRRGRAAGRAARDRTADQVVLAPGSLYTSLLPVLCVEGCAAPSRTRGPGWCRSPTSALSLPRRLGSTAPTTCVPSLDHGVRVDTFLYAQDGRWRARRRRGADRSGVCAPVAAELARPRFRARSATVGEGAARSAVVPASPEGESMAVRVGINGFGRIGRSFTRALLSRGDAAVELAAVNDPMGDNHTMAFLLKHDSVGGMLPNSVEATDDGFTIDGRDVPATRRHGPGRDPVVRLRRQRRDRVDRPVHRHARRPRSTWAAASTGS